MPLSLSHSGYSQGVWASESPSVRRSLSVGMDPLSQWALAAIKRPTSITLGKCRQSGHLGSHLGACDLGVAGVQIQQKKIGDISEKQRVAFECGCACVYVLPAVALLSG